MFSRDEKGPSALFLFLFGVLLLVQDGQDIYLEVFRAEVEAFIRRVKEYAAQHESALDHSSQQVSIKCSLVPKDVPDALPPVSAAQSWLNYTHTHTH